MGGINPITVNENDIVWVTDGVISSTDDGAEFEHLDAADAVVSVTIGGGTPQVGAISIPTASNGVAGVLDLATVAKDRVFADDVTVSPMIPGAPRITEIEAFITTAGVTDTLLFYTGTNTITDPVTHVYSVDGSGNATLLRSPTTAAVSNHTHITDTALSPAAAGAPTLAEITAYVTTNTITDTVIYYTGNDTATDPATYVYIVDTNGAVLAVVMPTLPSMGGIEQFHDLTVTAVNTVAALPVVPVTPAAVRFYVNGVLDYAKQITADATGVVTVAGSFNTTYGSDINLTDSISAVYLG